MLAFLLFVTWVSGSLAWDLWLSRWEGVFCRRCLRQDDALAGRPTCYDGETPHMLAWKWQDIPGLDSYVHNCGFSCDAPKGTIMDCPKCAPSPVPTQALGSVSRESSIPSRRPQTREQDESFRYPLTSCPVPGQPPL